MDSQKANACSLLTDMFYHHELKLINVFRGLPFLYRYMQKLINVLQNPVKKLLYFLEHHCTTICKNVCYRYMLLEVCNIAINLKFLATIYMYVTESGIANEQKCPQAIPSPTI